ncbi:hypothetical protein EDI_237470 [Entamoeba dispar SAW760]|uniref:BTB domain-containing protein n=1 Tax=Entamoeba dispar (strain ATCC PRA-260 / SAW760) TaxID=370354 RepID=B0EP89_ENTDS|nr:uncharacterized protein EDI_237470 [Entamoeba dispar SAW760]EDR23660.1 hypothetical protein EDI_237470 [Entamoeba dispar SAW760]|eukprot:EDR23660.1 hypothetical protein EDI_237470 [Entamoeba dispar SAW760]
MNNLIECPICGQMVPQNQIEEHANLCLDAMNEGRTPPIVILPDEIDRNRNQRRENSNNLNSSSSTTNQKYNNLDDLLNSITRKENNETKDIPEEIENNKSNLNEVIASPPIEEHIVSIQKPIDVIIDINELSSTGIYQMIQTKHFNNNSNKGFKGEIQMKFKEQQKLIELPIELNNPVDPLIYMANQSQKSKKDIHSEDIPIGWGLKENVYKEIMDKDKRYFDTIIYFPNEPGKYIRAHSFILASRSPLFQIELERITKIEGIFLYEIKQYKYDNFLCFINVLYGAVPRINLTNSNEELKDIDGMYSPSSKNIINDILNLQNSNFFDGYFIITKEGNEIERIGFNRILFYLFSDYFKELFDKKQINYINDGIKRNLSSISSLGLDITQITPTGDYQPFIFKIKGDNEEICYIHQAITEFIKYIYLNGYYSLEEDKIDEITTQRVIPILLHFGSLFKQNSLVVICEKILGHNLIINPINCNTLFYSMRSSSDRFKQFLINGLLETLIGFTQIDIIEQWRKEIIDMIYELTKDLTGYTFVNKENGELPLEPTCINIRDIPKLASVAMVSFINQNSDKSLLISQLCINKFSTLIHRKDIIEFLCYKGFRDILPILITCFIGSMKKTKVQESLKIIVNDIIVIICHSFSILSTIRGYIPITEEFMNIINTTLQSCCLFFILFFYYLNKYLLTSLVQNYEICCICGDQLGFFSKKCELCQVNICKKCMVKGMIINFKTKNLIQKNICYRCHRIWQFLSSEEYYQINK